MTNGNFQLSLQVLELILIPLNVCRLTVVKEAISIKNVQINGSPREKADKDHCQSEQKFLSLYEFLSGLTFRPEVDVKNIDRWC